MTAAEGKGLAATLRLPPGHVVGEPYFVPRDADALRASVKASVTDGASDLNGESEVEVDDGWLITFVTEIATRKASCMVRRLSCATSNFKVFGQNGSNFSASYMMFGRMFRFQHGARKQCLPHSLFFFFFFFFFFVIMMQNWHPQQSLRRTHNSFACAARTRS